MCIQTENKNKTKTKIFILKTNRIYQYLKENFVSTNKTRFNLFILLQISNRVAPRSGLAWKKHIDVGAGVIDADYRGNVGVVLFNHGDEDLKSKHKLETKEKIGSHFVSGAVAKGDRIAQLVLERIVTPDVEEVNELDDTERGAGGFGSTGTAAKQ